MFRSKFAFLQHVKKKQSKYAYLFLILDLEGDRITLFNTLDFGIFYEAQINKVFVEVGSSVTPTSPTNPSTSTGTTGAATGPKVRHTNVICDQCDRDIYGFRYKCMECYDYDLCMDCESKMGHKEHLMLRIPDPKDADTVSTAAGFLLPNNLDKKVSSIFIFCFQAFFVRRKKLDIILIIISLKKFFSHLLLLFC